MTDRNRELVPIPLQDSSPCVLCCCYTVCLKSVCLSVRYPATDRIDSAAVTWVIYRNEKQLINSNSLSKAWAEIFTQQQQPRYVRWVLFPAWEVVPGDIIPFKLPSCASTLTNSLSPPPPLSPFLPTPHLPTPFPLLSRKPPVPEVGTEDKINRLNKNGAREGRGRYRGGGGGGGVGGGGG